MCKKVCSFILCFLLVILVLTPTYSSEEDADILKSLLDVTQADLSGKATFTTEEFDDFFATLNSITSHLSQLKVKTRPILPLFNPETGNPRVAVIGGGYTGVISSILLARLKKAGTPALDVHLFEKNLNVLNGASTAPARLHLGGEYPKDSTTALQCLISALIFRQMFPTESILTTRKRIDFLLARESEEAKEEDQRLTLAELHGHYQKLQQTYKELLQQFGDWGDGAAPRLFGTLHEFFSFLGSAEAIEDERLRPHFTGGVRTSERGFQPIALGVILERLLVENNVHVHLGRSVTKVRSIDGEGYGFLHYSKNDQDEKEFLARYVVNAAWDEAPYLTYQASAGPAPVTVTEGSPVLDPIRNQPPTKVYLRSIGLFDVSRCVGIPTERSYFGLVGRAGAMVSFFSPTVAMIYVPEEDLSYQGLYNLSSHSEREAILDTAAQIRLVKLSELPEQSKVLNAMLRNVQEKYPFLRGAEPIQLITQTTLSWDNKVYQRQHIKPYWALGEGGRWIQASATKATFAPLIALQVLRKITRQEDVRSRVDLSNRAFLAKICETDLENIGSMDPGVMQALLSEFVRVPEEFVLFRETIPADDPKFLAEMQLYAFKRHLPMAMVEVFMRMGIPASLGLTDEIPLIDWENLDHVDLRSVRPTTEMLTTLAAAIRRLPRTKVLESFRFQYYTVEEDISEGHARAGIQVLKALSGERRFIKELEIDRLWFTLADEVEALASIILRNGLEKLTLTEFASYFTENNSLAQFFLIPLDKANSLKKFKLSFHHILPRKDTTKILLLTMTVLPSLNELSISNNRLGTILDAGETGVGSFELLEHLIRQQRGKALRDLDIAGNELFEGTRVTRLKREIFACFERNALDKN